jgi:hypothetical protein
VSVPATLSDDLIVQRLEYVVEFAERVKRVEEAVLHLEGDDEVRRLALLLAEMPGREWRQALAEVRESVAVHFR